MILVDTSVWVEHLRRPHAGLTRVLDQGQAVVHPFVIGEIALGSLHNRTQVLSLLADLPSIPIVPHGDVMEVVERRRLGGAGIGWVDAHLLAGALVNRLPLWTFDRRLGDVARRVGAAVTQT